MAKIFSLPSPHSQTQALKDESFSQKCIKIQLIATFDIRYLHRTPLNCLRIFFLFLEEWGGFIMTVIFSSLSLPWPLYKNEKRKLHVIFLC